MTWICFDRRQIDDAHLVVRRRAAARPHVVLNVLRAGRQRGTDSVARAVHRAALHGHRLPLGFGAFDSARRAAPCRGRRPVICAVMSWSLLRRTATLPGVTVIAYSGAVLRPGPQQRGAVADVTRAGDDHPDQHAKAGTQPRLPADRACGSAHQLGGRASRAARQRVCRQQFEERVVAALSRS